MLNAKVRIYLFTHYLIRISFIINSILFFVVSLSSNSYFNPYIYIFGLIPIILVRLRKRLYEYPPNILRKHLNPQKYLDFLKELARITQTNNFALYAEKILCNYYLGDFERVHMLSKSKDEFESKALNDVMYYYYLALVAIQENNKDTFIENIYAIKNAIVIEKIKGKAHRFGILGLEKLTLYGQIFFEKQEMESVIEKMKTPNKLAKIEKEYLLGLNALNISDIDKAIKHFEKISRFHKDIIFVKNAIFFLNAIINEKEIN